MAVEIELYFAVVSLIISALNIVGLFLEHVKSSERIASLETKVEPFWELVRSNASAIMEGISRKKSNPHSNPRNPDSMESRKKALLDKLEKRTLYLVKQRNLEQC